LDRRGVLVAEMCQRGQRGLRQTKVSEGGHPAVEGTRWRRGRITTRATRHATDVCRLCDGKRQADAVAADLQTLLAP